jgi:HK97 family phage portal protein
MLNNIFNVIVGRTDTHHSAQMSAAMIPNTFNISNPEAVSVANTCVKILAETLGGLPLEIYTAQEGKGKLKDRDHHLYPILHSQPNSYTNSNMFFQALEWHRNYRGNAFALIHRNNGSGRVESLEVISASRVIGYQLKDDQVYYLVTTKDGKKQEPINATNMLHFRMQTDDGIWGVNPILSLKMNMSSFYKGSQTMDTFYENNAFSPKALKSTVATANVAHLDEAISDFEKQYAGSAKAGKVIKLPPNTELQDLAIDFQTAQIIESMRMNSQQISAHYGVPVFMSTGDYTQSKFNSIEAMQIGFKVHTVAPITKMYKAELESKLLTEKDRKENRSIEFNINSLVEPDTKTKIEYYKGLIYTGAMTPQQVAIFEGLPADESQDIHLIQTNMMGLEYYRQKEEKGAQVAKNTAQEADPTKQKETKKENKDE